MENIQVLWLCCVDDRPVGLVKAYDEEEQRWIYYIGTAEAGTWMRTWSGSWNADKSSMSWALSRSSARISGRRSGCPGRLMWMS